MTIEATRPSDVSAAPREPEFSVVITCYFEEQSIEEFHARLSAVLEGTGRSYEIIFVNDGSSDGTLERLRGVFERDPHVTRVVDLFKNAGQAAAITAGITEANGRNFVLMDSDLQLEPEELPLLLAKFDEGNDIVSGYRPSRRDSRARRLPSKIANMIMRKASGSELSDFGCTFKIFRGPLVRAFDYGPAKKFNPVDVISQAGRIAEVAVSHHLRAYGQSGWTFRKLFAFNMDNIVRLSEAPFQLLAMIFVALSALLSLRIVAGFFVSFSIFPDVTNALVLYAIMIGLLVTMAVLCALGEFSIRSFLALQQTPSYVVREILRK
jgi:glycosyltransferase involved in cell wall biosynthesis